MCTIPSRCHRPAKFNEKRDSLFCDAIRRIVWFEHSLVRKWVVICVGGGVYGVWVCFWVCCVLLSVCN